MANSSITLKVTPGELEKQAKSVTRIIEKIEKDFNGIEQVVNGTNYWQGAASEKHKKIFEENKKDISEILKRLREHPEDLKTMAGIYSETENENENIAKELPADVIS